MNNEFLKRLKQCLEDGKWRITNHAMKRCDERGIDISDIIEYLPKCEIIETYPKDSRRASCLVLVKDAKKRPIHVVCAFDSEEHTIIVTVYRPTERKWIDERTRRVFDE
ncbi:DUF4258 domain-containing protein [Syntrophaceticus schinkii]|jgi:hypothetical protein|uniref:DUF4258 domain-containing protein n=1 Tax=Syntrophaceticus schinkii TaxID=499207 RepID=A0A0B7MQG7_9FIRM|nr:DUF4258 domain-containing protein [Syntrophaceticus schinkii]CEO90403.1 conserved hypothetical protein [Syntrophaceticus schinkii]